MSSADPPTALEAALAWVRVHPDLGRPSNLDRAVAIPFVRTEIVRPAALRAWRDRIASSSSSASSSGASGSSLDIDVAFLGAGVANAALALALHRARPDLAIAVIDRDVPGGPFARVGAAFRLNTWSAPGPTGMSLRDEVDLHGGLVVSPAQMSSARFPTGDTLADAALLTWLAMPVTVIAGEVRAIRDDNTHRDGAHRPEERDKRVTFVLDGDREVYSRTAIVGTGFGAEPNYTFDAPGIAFLRSEASRPAGERRVFDVETMFALVGHLGVRALDAVGWRDARDATTHVGANRDLDAPDLDGDLAVIGSGPSALAILALACGLGPIEVTDALGRAASRDRRPRITWITGTHGPASAAAARDRRAEHGHMDYVIAEGSATLLHELAHLEAIGRLRVVAGRARTLSPCLHVRAEPGSSDRRRRERVAIAVGDTSYEVDRVVVCTGYRPRVAALFGAPSLASLIANGSASAMRVDGEDIAITMFDGHVHLVGAAIEEALAPDVTRPPFAEAVVRARVIADRLSRSLPRGRAADTRASATNVSAAADTAADHAAPTGLADHTRAHANAFRAHSRPWDRMLAPLDLLLAIAPVRFVSSRSIAIHVDERGRVTCAAVDAETCTRIAHRLPVRLVACAERHDGIAITVEIDDHGFVVPASAR